MYKWKKMYKKNLFPQIYVFQRIIIKFSNIVDRKSSEQLKIYKMLSFPVVTIFNGSVTVFFSKGTFL